MGGAPFAQSFADRNRTLSSRILPEAGTAQCACLIRGIAPLGLVMVECDYDWGGRRLILGYTDRGRPLHVQCSYPSRPLVKIVTVYEPDPSLWMDLRIRKRD